MRLYTGPMYVWYNVRVLRKGLKGQFVTTIHCISSAIVKMAKLQKTATVYRGVSGGVLPESFFTPDANGSVGGVEAAFMSTSTNREVRSPRPYLPWWHARHPLLTPLGATRHVAGGNGVRPPLRPRWRGPTLYALPHPYGDDRPRRRRRVRLAIPRGEGDPLCAAHWSGGRLGTVG